VKVEHIVSINGCIADLGSGRFVLPSRMVVSFSVGVLRVDIGIVGVEGRRIVSRFER
jgi:hypothetical protein